MCSQWSTMFVLAGQIHLFIWLQIRVAATYILIRCRHGSGKYEMDVNLNTENSNIFTSLAKCKMRNFRAQFIVVICTNSQKFTFSKKVNFIMCKKVHERC